MIYFCKVQGKNEKAYNHLILFVHQSPYDKVRRHLPKIIVKSGCFQLLGSSAAPAITISQDIAGLKGVLLATGDGKPKSDGRSCWP
jgi:hypothetical protein